MFSIRCPSGEAKVQEGLSLALSLSLPRTHAGAAAAAMRRCFLSLPSNLQGTVEIQADDRDLRPRTLAGGRYRIVTLAPHPGSFLVLLSPKIRPCPPAAAGVWLGFFWLLVSITGGVGRGGLVGCTVWPRKHASCHSPANPEFGGTTAITCHL